MEHWRIRTRILINIGLIIAVLVSSLLIINFAYAVDNHILVSTPHGNGLASTWDNGNYTFTIRSHGNEAGSHYFIEVYGKRWGQCSPDMTGCTATRWKIKDVRSNTQWWSTIAIDTQLSSFITGITTTQHSFQKYQSSSLIRGYTSDVVNNGAGNSNCFYNGPGPQSNPIPCP